MQRSASSMQAQCKRNARMAGKQVVLTLLDVIFDKPCALHGGWQCNVSAVQVHASATMMILTMRNGIREIGLGK